MINDFKAHIDRLRASGLRPTQQRLAICKALFERSETIHFTIERLKKIVEKNTRNKISMATMYNTIHAFKEKGYLKEISLKTNQTFFDTNTKVHHHFYDEETGKLLDIKDEDVLLQKVPKAPKGKKIKTVEIIVNIATNNQIQ